MRYMERTVLLRLIDQYWKEHLLNLDRLRQGINLRAYAQRDPLNEYKQEAFSLFERMSATIREETVKTLSLFEIPQEASNILATALLDGNVSISRSDRNIVTNKPDVAVNLFSIPRNATCPCGSGKKYKHCCCKVKSK